MLPSSLPLLPHSKKLVGPVVASVIQYCKLVKLSMKVEDDPDTGIIQRIDQLVGLPQSMQLEYLKYNKIII